MTIRLRLALPIYSILIVPSSASHLVSRSRPAALPGRLGDLNAAVALVQLDRLDEFAARRREIAAQYDSALAKLPHWKAASSCADHSYYRYIVRTNSPSTPLAASLRELGVDARPSVNPLARCHPRFTGAPFVPGAFPSADRWRDHLLSLPIYPGLTDEDAQRVDRPRALPDHA